MANFKMLKNYTQLDKAFEVRGNKIFCNACSYTI